jgi:hypothetical protein
VAQPGPSPGTSEPPSRAQHYGPRRSGGRRRPR